MAARKAATKKAADPVEEQDASQPAPTTEMEGEHYQNGYTGVSHDDADYSIAAEVARLAKEQ